MIRGLLFDIVGLVGMALLAYGLYQIYPPSMYVVIGLLLLCFSIKAQSVIMPSGDKSRKG